jgi:hypothetical protein
MFKKLLPITELLLPRKPVEETTLYYNTATMEACNWNQSWASSAKRGWTADI